MAYHPDVDVRHLIEVYQTKIANAEAQIERIQNEPAEVWQESGYYLQQEISELQSYCHVLYRKLESLYINDTE